MSPTVNNVFSSVSKEILVVLFFEVLGKREGIRSWSENIILFVVQTFSSEIETYLLDTNHCVTFLTLFLWTPFDPLLLSSRFYFQMWWLNSFFLVLLRAIMMSSFFFLYCLQITKRWTVPICDSPLCFAFIRIHMYLLTF